jgi:hypothetical protein
LILKIKSIIIIIIIINLDQTSPFKSKKIRARKGRLTQVAWVCQGRILKSLVFYSPANPMLWGQVSELKVVGSVVQIHRKCIRVQTKAIGSSVRTQG